LLFGTFRRSQRVGGEVCVRMGFSYNVLSCIILVALHLETSDANRIHIHSRTELDSQLQGVQSGHQTSAPATALKRSEEAGASLLAERATAQEVDFQKVFQEFFGTALFVFFGCGSAMSVAKRDCSNGWILQVALSFGFAIFVLLQCGIANQMNCAVTVGLIISDKVSFQQGICNIVAQMLGSLTGALMLKIMFPIEKDLTGDLGTNTVASGWTFLGAFVGEFIGTFLLMLVVLAVVNSSTSDGISNLAIGLAVFLAHSVLIPVDGCSINPTRSFGPAVMQAISGKNTQALMQLWIFWLGPLLGAAFAPLVYHVGYSK